jgi:hypothetical protein
MRPAGIRQHRPVYHAVSVGVWKVRVRRVGLGCLAIQVNLAWVRSRYGQTVAQVGQEVEGHNLDDERRISAQFAEFDHPVYDGPALADGGEGADPSARRQCRVEAEPHPPTCGKRPTFARPASSKFTVCSITSTSWRGGQRHDDQAIVKAKRTLDV